MLSERQNIMGSNQRVPRLALYFYGADWCLGNTSFMCECVLVHIFNYALEAKLPPEVS